MALIESIEIDDTTYVSSVKMAVYLEMAHNNLLKFLKGYCGADNSWLKEGEYINRKGVRQRMLWVPEAIANSAECTVLEKREAKKRSTPPTETIYGGSAFVPAPSSKRREVK